MERACSCGGPGCDRAACRVPAAGEAEWRVEGGGRGGSRGRGWVALSLSRPTRLRVLGRLGCRRFELGGAACLGHLDVADPDRKARAKGGVHREVAHNQPMHVRRLERRFVRPRAARHDPHLLRLAGVDDLTRALEVTVRYRVEAAAEHRDARVARRRAVVQRERLLRAGAGCRQLVIRGCGHQQQRFFSTAP